MSNSWRQSLTALQRFTEKFAELRITTMAASLAFYTALSLAPILVLFVVTSSFFSLDLQKALVESSAGMIGPDGGQVLDLLIKKAQSRSDLSGIAGFFGLFSLLISSGFFFGELRESLSRIFDKKRTLPEEMAWFQWLLIFLRDRIFHIFLALSFILILTAALIISSLLSSPLLGSETINIFLHAFISFLLFSLFFTLTFHYTPESPVPWAQSFLGGVLTTTLFVVGTEGVGFYLGQNALGSAYGAAGSIVIFLAWIYYSALITLCGALLSETFYKEWSE